MFWIFLFLHLTNLSAYDQSELDKLKQNNRINKSKSSPKFCEDVLKNKIKKINSTENYSKAKYNAEFFVNRLNELFQNAQTFAQENGKLKTQLGSSLVPIIKRIYDEAEEWQAR